MERVANGIRRPARLDTMAEIRIVRPTPNRLDIRPETNAPPRASNASAATAGCTTRLAELCI